MRLVLLGDFSGIYDFVLNINVFLSRICKIEDVYLWPGRVLTCTLVLLTWRGIILSR